jgi:hypothetical protein
VVDYKAINWLLSTFFFNERQSPVRPASLASSSNEKYVVMPLLMNRQIVSSSPQLPARDDVPRKKSFEMAVSATDLPGIYLFS